ncbi:glutaredoxin family protein [Leucobacter aridicollis]|uniref:Glutaredoxin n=1 Tax=Leucobacter aridicollis TaxID=283878 RepID=A0A852QX20_9MICO|nr:glutaredoxin domain-containing protein [Leucobacter aridicollis]MBL3682030.1 glutaredoxin family protein [Leucobacter aridicollis]NYD26923.1 glutaredoxin [Leucobacter aridicollis]
MPTQQITIFTAGPSCIQCRLTEKLLSSLGFAYELRPADALSDELRAQAMALGAVIQAPLVLVRDASGELAQAWGGYRPDLIDVLAGERMLAA